MYVQINVYINVNVDIVGQLAATSKMRTIRKNESFQLDKFQRQESALSFETCCFPGFVLRPFVTFQKVEKSPYKSSAALHVSTKL
jgi:hypothetical protein